MSATDETSASDRSVCRPCRGTGKVFSSLGGEAHEVTCPWCDGTGSFIAGRDAQAAQAGDQAASAENQAPSAENNAPSAEST